MKNLPLVVFVSLLVTGCATAWKPLTKEVLPSDNPMQAIHLAIVDDELAADVKSSYVAAVAGGGLLAALIDVAIESARSKKAARLLEPIRNAVVEYDFAQDFVSQLARIDIPAIAQNATVIASSQSELNEKRDHATKPLFSVTARQVFSYDFKSVRVEAAVSYLTPSSDPGTKPNEHTKTYVSEHPAPVPEGTDGKDELGQAWAEDADYLKQVLHRGIAEVLNLLQRDLDPTQGFMATEEVRFLTESTRLSGPLYDKQGDRVIVGYKDRIIAISQAHLLE